MHRSDTSFRAVFKELNKVLWVRTSLIVMAIMFFDGLVFGYGQALMPIAAVNVFGYTTPQWSQLVAMMGAHRRRSRAWDWPGNRPHGCKTHAGVGHRAARHSRTPDRTDSGPVAEHTLCAADAVDLGNDDARGHGLEPRTRNGDLQKR